jgi:TetR/AcrR family transcriptional regulator, transcriptional repressor for nem operon
MARQGAPRTGRPKGYDRDAVLVLARDLFWERGYEATSISDLELRTGINRSSLYREFGSKRDLFTAALESYTDRVVATLVADLRKPGASLEAVVSLFARLAVIFRSQASVTERGCLLVNATAELAARDKGVQSAAASYRDDLRATFAAALTHAAELGEIDARVVQVRAHILASTLMGVWLAVRIDPQDAAALCGTIAGEVASWRQASS